MIEYQSGAPGEEHPEDATGELAVGRSLLPERVRLTARSRGIRLTVQLGSGLILVAAVVVAVRYGRGGGSGAPTRPPPTVAAVATTKPGPPSPLDRVSALAAVRQFTTNIRQSSSNRPCPAVTPGHDPQAAVVAVVADTVPGVRAIGASRTIDQFTGLCALNVVLGNPHGGTVTVSVSAPTTIPGDTLDTQEVGLQNVTDGVVEYAQVGWHTGWRVLVGATGGPNILTTTTELSAVANSPTLLW